jgi:hypothetical protein
MSQQQAAHRMSSILLPGNQREEFEYFILLEAKTGIAAAMVKFPKSLGKPFEKALKENEEGELLWVLTNRQDEADEDGKNDASRYEMRGLVFQKSMLTSDTKPEELIDMMEKDSLQDGYVYLPKVLRDGKHADHYLLRPIDEDTFKTRTERGMYEEVAWSPFGSIDEATKQEAQNLERNPLMRNWS